MRDETGLRPESGTYIDAGVLRHMMHETIDMLDASAEYTDEACRSTDAAMALTRADWILMAIFGWLSQQLQASQFGAAGAPLGPSVPEVGIDPEKLSDDLCRFSRAVDRLYLRVRQLDALCETETSEPAAARSRHGGGRVLYIFGDPPQAGAAPNPVRASRQRLRKALAET